MAAVARQSQGTIGLLSPRLEPRVTEPDLRRAVFMFTRVSGREGRGEQGSGIE